MLPVQLLTGHGQDDGTPPCSAGVQEKGQHAGRSPVHSPPCAVLLFLRALRHFPHPLRNVLWRFLMLGAEQKYRCLFWRWWLGASQPVSARNAVSVSPGRSVLTFINEQ